jgi:hypothetical protein
LVVENFVIHKGNHMRSITIAGFGLCAAVILGAYSQGRAATTPFDKGPVKFVLVQYSGGGDFFELWTKGSGAPGSEKDEAWRRLE